eukprot:jgi/Phyca11/572653/estExt2_Genewise1.C_PHYCAscaffold_490072
MFNYQPRRSPARTLRALSDNTPPWPRAPQEQKACDRKERTRSVRRDEERTKLPQTISFYTKT